MKEEKSKKKNYLYMLIVFNFKQRNLSYRHLSIIQYFLLTI